MMFMSFFCADVNSMEPTTIDTEPTEYMEISNAIFDEVYMDGDTNIPYDMVIPEWGYTTILDAKFNGNLLAGNVDFTLDSVNAMRLKRRKAGEYKWILFDEHKIVTEEDFNYVYNDITVASNTHYQYAAVPVINGAEGTYQTVDIYARFEGAFVIDPTYGYQIILNMEQGTTTRSIPANVVETVNGKYPYVFYTSQASYDRSSISGILMGLNDTTCEWDLDGAWRLRQSFREFASNRRSKLVKRYDGAIWLANIIDAITDSPAGHPQIATTNFSFVEVGDAASNRDLYEHGFIQYLEVFE